MPNWNEVLQEIQGTQTQLLTVAAQHQQAAQNSIGLVRKKYLAELHKKTGRNIIVYYSGFLSKPALGGLEINDEDKNGFMMAVHKLDRRLGLDLILHTPGGGISSTQSIVDYLHKMFRADRNSPPDIRAIVPQMAMSAGTMIACSCKEILMAKHSNLGPIDPQLAGVPAYGVLNEFKRACDEIKSDPNKIPIWQPIISQYRPTFLSRCENAILHSNSFVKKQLAAGMFHGQAEAAKKARHVVKCLTHYTKNKTHDRHIHFDECHKMGLCVKLIEEVKDTAGQKDEVLQDLILTVHHCYMHTLMNTNVYKIIENHLGTGIAKAQIATPQAKPNQGQVDY